MAKNNLHNICLQVYPTNLIDLPVKGLQYESDKNSKAPLSR